MVERKGDDTADQLARASVRPAPADARGIHAIVAESPGRSTVIPAWARAWQRLLQRRIGIVPVPVFVLLAAITWYFVAAQKVVTDLPMMIAVVAIFGFACAEIGQRIPGVRSVGGGAIFATFLPSALVFYHVLSPVLVTAVTQFTKASNFLYLYVAAVIVGSVFGIDRTMLIRGFVKIFVPLAAGSLAALLVGTAVGTVLGLGLKHALLYIVIPVMAGGVGEGALPLAMGYAGIVHQPFGTQFAQVLPPVMIGSLMAILIAGALNTLGKKRPQLSGNGRLQPGDRDFSQEQPSGQVDVMHIAAAAVTAVSLYLLGVLAQRLIGLPAPVVMLFLAVLMKLSWSVTGQLQLGAEVVFQLFAKAGTYPLLFMVGVAMTPWDQLIAALAPANLLTIAATVTTIIAGGFFVGRMVNLYPIEAAIVNATHAGQGGTGGVAILTAAERMQLMPFAQIAIRIGGAIVVTLTLLTFARLH
jgi:Na+/citrate or Na+/malate symporter